MGEYTTFMVGKQEKWHYSDDKAGTFTNILHHSVFFISLLCYFRCLFSFDEIPTEDTSQSTYTEIDKRTVFTPAPKESGG